MARNTAAAQATIPVIASSSSRRAFETRNRHGSSRRLDLQSWARTPMKLDFVTVDVFTGTQFAGNPLAVVLNAKGLTGGQMQAIAAEFNLAETTFVLPPKDPANTAEVRIFTPRYEMPFAGHPNVGTAFALSRAGASYGRAVDGESVSFEEKAGIVPISLLKDAGTVTGARLASPQLLTLGAEISTELIASACGLAVDDIETGNHSPIIASCGAPFILAELKDRARLAAAAARADVFAREISRLPVTSIFIYANVAEDGLDIRARMFAPHHGIPEDPATGSANVALIGPLARLRPESDVRISRTIAQGVEMGRPSLLQAEAEKEGGTVTSTYIGGRCVPVMSGIIELA
jgi:trans-2,3-dihydro-3-hydroxyanthranilate isomerase